MASFNPFGGLGNFAKMGGTFGSIATILLIAIPIMAGVLGLAYLIYKKKKWNLDVEFKLPRSDGRIVNAEWGKGFYNFKRGICYLKRKKKAKVFMKPFNVGKYLQGDRVLTVIQVGPNEYRPVLNNSWTELENDKPLRDDKGKLIRDKNNKPIYEKAALMNIRIDTTEDKAWATYCEREGKGTYSIMSLLAQYAPAISIGLIIVLWGIQFIILYTRIK